MHSFRKRAKCGFVSDSHGRIGMDTVIALLGGVALFLYGMMLMGNGLKAVAGSRLELIFAEFCWEPASLR